MVPSLLLAVKGREPGMFFLQWGYRDRKDGRLWMGAVGLNTAGRTEEPCVGLNRDTNKLKPPSGHLPSPYLVECVFACHSLPSLSPTYSKKKFGSFLPVLLTLVEPPTHSFPMNPGFDPFFCFPSAISPHSLGTKKLLKYTLDSPSCELDL